VINGKGQQVFPAEELDQHRTAAQSTRALGAAEAVMRLCARQIRRI
jgi:hypothetical protein